MTTAPHAPYQSSTLDDAERKALFLDAFRWAIGQIQIPQGSGILHRLYGPRFAWIRAGMLAIITGKKVPVSRPEVGWYRFNSFLFGQIQPQGGCAAERESNFDAFIWSELAK